MNTQRKDVWSFNLEQKLFIEVHHWGVDRDNPAFTAINKGQGVWNYYVYIPERVIGTEVFERDFWLEDKLIKFSGTSPERVTHNYMSAPFNDVDWHGGVTFYEKNGHTKGHRTVKIGCDFSHLWDQERGFNYTFEEVAQEAMETAKQLKEKYNL